MNYVISETNQQRACSGQTAARQQTHACPQIDNNKIQTIKITTNHKQEFKNKTKNAAPFRHTAESI